jgi:paraquat-inducible protein B
VLYAQKTTFQDSNFELLQQHVNDKVRTRSLLLLFTNFENPFTLQRSLPYLLQLKKRNLLVVVMFKNEELEQFSTLSPNNQRQFYQGILASKMLIEKEKMAKQLNAMGIQTILTKPEELSTAVINKYLTLKAKGLL